MYTLPPNTVVAIDPFSALGNPWGCDRRPNKCRPGQDTERMDRADLTKIQALGGSMQNSNPFRKLAGRLRHLAAINAGYDFSYSSKIDGNDNGNQTPNRLREFFDSRKEGRGIWKWLHYFDIYDRHFSKFKDHDVKLLEIGIYSGGSLDMWRDYFGPRATIYGVDIEPACRAYERGGVKVFIGDQADRSFWRELKSHVSTVDIVIDDGGHQAEQQIVSLEELLPILSPGGVYLCEDIHNFNRFASYVHGLAHKLNVLGPNGETTAFQKAVNSIHLYPFITVIEKNKAALTYLQAEKRGTEWQPFLGTP
jgi:23S rRNA U2552 (ribose-2'-O)-methylase RlmE/FtsJ